MLICSKYLSVGNEMIGVLGHDFAARLYWAGDNLPECAMARRDTFYMYTDFFKKLIHI